MIFNGWEKKVFIDVVICLCGINISGIQFSIGEVTDGRKERQGCKESRKEGKLSEKESKSEELKGAESKKIEIRMKDQLNQNIQSKKKEKMGKREEWNEDKTNKKGK